MDYAEALADIRRIMVAGLPGETILWPGENPTGGTPPPTGDPSDPSIFYDVDLRGQRTIEDESYQQIAFGIDRAQGMTLEIGIAHELMAGADAECRARAVALEGLAWINTDSMIYRVAESWLSEGLVWQDVYWLTPWILNIERYDT